MSTGCAIGLFHTSSHGLHTSFTVYVGKTGAKRSSSAWLPAHSPGRHRRFALVEEFGNNKSVSDSPSPNVEDKPREHLGVEGRLPQLELEHKILLDQAVVAKQTLTAVSQSLHELQGLLQLGLQSNQDCLLLLALDMLSNEPLQVLHPFLLLVFEVPYNTQGPSGLGLLLGIATEPDTTNLIPSDPIRDLRRTSPLTWGSNVGGTMLARSCLKEGQLVLPPERLGGKACDSRTSSAAMTQVCWISP